MFLLVSCLSLGLIFYVIWQPKEVRRSCGSLFNLFFKEGSQNRKLKRKTWNYTHLLWILVKEGVVRDSLIFFSFYINIKFHVKVISSLARVLQKVVGIWFFFIWFEVRFFNFAKNKASCDSLTLILNIAYFTQNKIINNLTVSALKLVSAIFYQIFIFH